MAESHQSNLICYKGNTGKQKNSNILNLKWRRCFVYAFRFLILSTISKWSTPLERPISSAPWHSLPISVPWSNPTDPKMQCILWESLLSWSLLITLYALYFWLLNNSMHVSNFFITKQCYYCFKLSENEAIQASWLLILAVTILSLQIPKHFTVKF